MSDIIRDFELLKCPFCGRTAMMEPWDMSPYEKMHIETIRTEAIAFLLTMQRKPGTVELEIN